MHMATPTKTVTDNLLNAIVGNGGHVGLMFTDIFDGEIKSIGDQIIALARGKLAAAGSTKEINEAVPRIGWHATGPPIMTADNPVTRKARSDAVLGARVRTGVVQSDHPASVRLEFGTAATSKKAGYTALKFMSGSALAVAAAHRGAIYEPHNDDFVAANRKSVPKAKATT